MQARGINVLLHYLGPRQLRDDIPQSTHRDFDAKAVPNPTLKLCRKIVDPALRYAGHVKVKAPKQKGQNSIFVTKSKPATLLARHVPPHSQHLVLMLS
ncbi:MAG: hypothetical protein CTY35_03735 [Methylotenera sp.]|nr:MAG: hypothetical protein CTY35_03735 [Methylotenera sp.]